MTEYPSGAIGDKNGPSNRDDVGVEEAKAGWAGLAFSTRQWDCINASLIIAQQKGIHEVFGEDFDYVYRWTKKVSSMP